MRPDEHYHCDDHDDYNDYYDHDDHNYDVLKSHLGLSAGGDGEGEASAGRLRALWTREGAATGDGDLGIILITIITAIIAIIAITIIIIIIVIIMTITIITILTILIATCSQCYPAAGRKCSHCFARFAVHREPFSLFSSSMSPL